MMTSPHVLFYVGADRFAGAEQSLQTLIAHLPEHLRVTVAGPHRSILEQIVGDRPACRIRTVPDLSSKAHLARIPALRRELVDLDPTAVHLNKVEVADLRYVELLLTLRSARVIAVVHHVERPVTAVARRLARFLARRADSVVAVSARSAIELERMLGLHRGAVTVVPNALPPLEGTPIHDPEDKPFTVGVLARMVPHKGVNHVIEAMIALPTTRLVIGGDGPERANLERMVEHMGLTAQVEFLGWVEPTEVFRRSHVLASAAYIEGHPMTLLDAQRRGLPVVAADVGGVGDIVEHNITGVLFPPGNVIALSRELDRLRRDPFLRAAMADAACERSAYRPGPVDMAASYCRLYDGSDPTIRLIVG